MGYALLFAAGAMLSMHCVGMCGGFVLLAQAAPGGKGMGRQLQFHLGRIASYAVLGAVAGGLGSLTALFREAGRLQAGLMVGAGLLMMAAGMAVWGWWRGWNPMGAVGLLPGGWVRAGLRASRRLPGPLLAASAGGLLGLLPCGLLYTMLLRAAASLNPGRGALVMACFGAGTIPALLGVALCAERLTAQRRQQVFRWSGLLLLGLGGVEVAQGLQWLRWMR